MLIQSFQDFDPSIESRAFGPNLVQSGFFGDHWSVKTFSVPWRQIKDTSAWGSGTVVVYVFWILKGLSNGVEFPGHLRRHINDFQQSAYIGKEQSFEFVPLNIGNDTAFVRADFSLNFFMQLLFQLFDRGISPVLESVEVDKRRYCIIRTIKMRHFGNEPFLADIAAANSANSCPAEQDWFRIDFLRQQVWGQYALYKLLFRLAFNGNRKPDQGWPPRRFFCHSSPGEKFSSSQLR